MRRLFAVGGSWSLCAVSCFPPPSTVDGTDAGTATTTTGGTGGTAAGTAGTTAGTGPSTSATSTTGPDPTSDSTGDTTSAGETDTMTAGSTGETMPAWLLACVADGFEIEPVPPSADGQVIVRFRHVQGLTNIAWEIVQATTTLTPGTGSCGNGPPLFCWDTTIQAGSLSPGPVDITFDADEIEPVTCAAQLD